MINHATLPSGSQFLEQGIKISSNAYDPEVYNNNSNDPVTIGPGSSCDLHKKVVAIKAPIVRILSLVNASKKLVIHTDVLIINGGYLTQPKKWDIQADVVKFKNINPKSLWLSSLVKDSAIHSSTFESQTDPDCNFDVEKKPTLGQKFTSIANEIKNMRGKIKHWITKS